MIRLPDTRSALVSVLAGALLACGSGGEATEGDSREVATDGGPIPEAVPAPAFEEGILIVTPEEVRRWADEGEPFVLIDARDQVQFGQEHIPGAINVPYVDIRAGGNLPPKDTRIVVYCSDADCPISRYAYESLEHLGYAHLYDMREGLQGWKAAGYPTVIGEASVVEDPAPE